MQSAQNLAQAAKDLLTNDNFKTDFKVTKSPKDRRCRIQIYGVHMGWLAEVDRITDRESIRLLLEHLLYAENSISRPNETPSYSLAQMLQAYGAITPTTPATNTMSKAITVTTQVNINGVNADNYTNAQLFAMIQQQETEIKNLQSISNKPQSLLCEMETRQAGIVALVSYMNERDAKLNPQPA